MNRPEPVRGDRPSPMRLTRRARYPNLSPTRPPRVPADAALWPSWTDAHRWELGPDLPLFDLAAGVAG